VKICDACGKVVSRLDSGPVELEPIEICDQCRQSVLQRLSDVERRVVEYRNQLRVETLAEWKKERAPRGPDGAT